MPITARFIISAIAERSQAKPWVVATSAQRNVSGQSVGFEQLVAERIAAPDRPMVLILGTGWGLHQDVLSLCDQVLMPISGVGPFNHLSVRAAVAITLDRLLG